MKRTRWISFFFAAAILVAASAHAQVVPMSRCRAAYPCAIPFAIQSRPDPLISGPYGKMGNTGLLVTVPLARPFAPRIETSRNPDLGAALEADIRRSKTVPAEREESDVAKPAPAQPLSEKPVPDLAIPDRAPVH